MPDLRSPLLTAELLSIGSELTTGETRDTNAGELARSLSEVGVTVLQITALPDDLAAVRNAFEEGVAHADLLVSTGGLGPTPDDLTREAIAAACGETVEVDTELEAWLRDLWSRRGLPFLDINLKQAWLIPSATAIPNDNGTAPGWWVDGPSATTIVALPGPPREMRPMWHGWALPRMRERGLGRNVATTTLRLAAIGESAVADLLGEALLRGSNPIVATYARSDAVDVRMSAVGTEDRTADALLAETEAKVRALIGDRVWATGDTTWGQAIGARLEELGWTLAIAETGTGTALAALLGEVPALVSAAASREDPRRAEAIARETKAASGATVALAVKATDRGGDTRVSVAVASPGGVHRQRHVVFLTGTMGRSRAALAGAAVLLERLRAVEAPRGPGVEPAPTSASGGPSAEGHRDRE